jgi:Kef-type K+ transport system membrane component KefB/mannitol/fructose-specific phosphotransferase system IIA component (Ntr-type)
MDQLPDVVNQSVSGHPGPQLPVQMVAVGLMILAAHMGGRLARRLRLSEVTGQLLGGALVGPYALGALKVLGEHQEVYETAVHGFHFFVFVFLGMVAFGIGEELHVNRLKAVGRTALIISIVQAVVTWITMSAAFFYLGRQSAAEALLIGSIGMASAPVVTFVLMNQLRIEGRLRNVVGSVIVLGDLFQVIVFSTLVQIADPGRMQKAGGAILLSVSKEMLIAVLLGGAIYLVLRLLVRRSPGCLDDEECEEFPSGSAFLHRILAEHPSPSAEIFLIVTGAVAIAVGIGYANHWPFLVTAVVAGFLVANFHSHAIFDSLRIETITPVLNLGFFALIGANLNLAPLSGENLWLVALYVVTRFVGKIAGTWLGCRLVGEDRKITAVVPSLMLPQAGVAAVEAVFVAAIIPESKISGIILPAIVVFEVAGVFLVERKLKLWRSWVTDEERYLRQPEPHAGRAEAARRLLTYLTPESVALELSGRDKDQIIEELVSHAERTTKQHLDTAQAVQLLKEREKLSPTGFGHGVAIPHCRLLGLQKPILVFARHKSGVPFGGVDDAPCDLFMLILSSGRDPSQHLRLLAAAGFLFSREATRAKLRAAMEPLDMMKVVEELSQGSSSE